MGAKPHGSYAWEERRAATPDRAALVASSRRSSTRPAPSYSPEREGPITHRCRCTTTAVVRRRGPRRMQLQVAVASAKHPGAARTPGLAGSSRGAARPPTLDLPLSTVRNLCSEINQVPQYGHPIFPIPALLSELERVQYQLDLLPSSHRTFAYAAMAVAALTTADPFVLGDSSATLPPSFYIILSDERFAGADLRAFGVKRAGVCSLIRKHAVRLARDEEVTVVCSTENAATCVLLDYLDLCDPVSNPSRSYASSAMAHLRVLADVASTLFSHDNGQHIRWCAFLMAEAITAVSHGSPLCISPHDEVAICGSDPSISMDQLNIQLQTDWSRSASSIGGSLLPFTRNLTHLARSLSENVVSGHAQRSALDFNQFESALSLLSTTRETLDLLSSHVAIAALTPDTLTPHLPRISHNLTLSWAILHLPLYRELRRRTEQALESGVELEKDEAERMEALSNRVRQATLKAAARLAEAVRKAPSFTFITIAPLTRLEEWTQIVLAEGETAAALGIDRQPTLKLLVQALKRSGWSHVDRSGTTETAELHLAVSDAFAPTLAAPTPVSDDAFWDQFLMNREEIESTSEDMLDFGGEGDFGDEGWPAGLQMES